MKTKIAKIIIDYFSLRGIKDVFILTGGAIAFMADAASKNKKIKLIPAYHEQGAAMMSDGYSRVSSTPSLCMATSGPGVTNLITGIACSWYDSKPNIFITGQVRSDEIRSKKNKTENIRQVGFQETDVISLTKSLTKFSYQLKKNDNIIKILDKAFYLATSGRKGPVLIDIPIDVQNLKKNKIKIIISKKKKSLKQIKKNKLSLIKEIFLEAKRPLILVGGGLQENDKKLFTKILKKIDVPVVNTWNGFDVLDFDNKNLIGQVGIYGNRAPNFALQNCDLLIVLGSRLESRVIGRDKKNFAKKAKIIHVDIDNYELVRKREKKNFINVNCSIETFLNSFITILTKTIKGGHEKPQLWLNLLKKLKLKNLIPGPEQNLIKKKTNPYYFFDKLSFALKKDSNIFISTGSTVTWAYQSFKIKSGQKFISANGHSPMGYALPASIGGYFADPKKICICIEGDGSFQLNFQEMQVAKVFKIPLKIIIINNNGYGIIRQFQDQNLKSKYVASGNSSSVKNPDFNKIAKVYNFKYFKIINNDQINKKLSLFLKKKEASILEVVVDKNFDIVPRIQLRNKLENMYPKKNIF